LHWSTRVCSLGAAATPTPTASAAAASVAAAAAASCEPNLAFERLFKDIKLNCYVCGSRWARNSGERSSGASGSSFAPTNLAAEPEA